MSTGIDTIDAAPLIIRTYNDDSANNTFLLTQYDYPVSSNFVLRTSDGSMAPSDALTQTTMGLSSMTISNHYGSTMVYGAFSSSYLFLPSGVYDTITKDTMTASSVTASTIFLNTLNICTMNASTFSPNGVFVSYLTIGSTVQVSSMTYSTLIGNSLFVNTVGVSTLNGSSLYGTLASVSTTASDTSRFSTLTMASTSVGTLSFSTLQGSTIVVSTLSSSSIYTNPLVVSTLDGGLLTMSTVSCASTIFVSSLYASGLTFSTTVGTSVVMSTTSVPLLFTNSLFFSTAQGSTVVVSSVAASSIYAPFLVGSTIQANTFAFSTLTASSMNTSNIVYSTAQGSTLGVSTMGVSTLVVSAAGYSTLSGSSMTTNTVGLSTLLGSTISWNRLVLSTFQGSIALVSSITVSSVAGSVVSTALLQGSTVMVSTFIGSSLNTNLLVGSTMTADSLFFSTLSISTLLSGSSVYSTLQGSTTTLSTLTVSTLSVSTMGVSTLSGSTLIGNVINVSSIQINGIIFSTLSGNTLLLSTLTSCSINAQTIRVSTLQGSTVVTSTLTGSTMVSGQITYSTLIGSSIVTDYISASTFTGSGLPFISTFSFASQQTSAAFLSTLIVNSTVTVSTLNRINPTSMTASTLTLSGGLQSNTATGLLVCSTLTVNAMNLTRSIVNQPVYGNTVKTDSIAAPSWSVIRTSGIRAFIDTAPIQPQTYTFGPAIPDRWIAAGTTINAISYSNDGFNWVGLGTSVMNQMRIAIWNGSIWVGVGDVGSISPVKSGLTANTWTQSGVTWTATASSTLSGWPIYTAFDGSLGSDGNAWASGTPNYLYNASGVSNYNGGVSTTVIGVPSGLYGVTGTSVAGEWLQIQLSTPLSILSYKWGCARASNQIKSYCLVGSNDGVTWYFIQYVSYPSSPCTNAYTDISTTLVASYTGAQTVTGNVSVNANTISSVYSGNLYTYFRMIGTQNFTPNVGVNTYMETGEWTITFSQSTIAYSYDGIKWTGLGTTIFTSYGLEVAWNGTMWVAVGGGISNSVAYSYDGINWTGLGKSVITGYGHAIAWNGTMWVVPGTGSNTLAYSYDGINWVGLGNSIFSGAYGVAWNGRMWIAVGEGSNAVAYSYDGIIWVGLGYMSFNTAGVGVAWNGTMWVILSAGVTSIAYSYDGINWISEGNTGTVNARYVRIEYADALVSRYLQIAGIRVYNSAGENIITTSMTVTASSNAGTVLTNVLDGDIGTFFHSNLETSPWLEIDLGSEQAIYKVEFVNRGDCCRGRIASARMVLKNNSGTVVYTSNRMTLKDGVTTTYQDAPGNEGYLYYNWWPVISTYAYGSDTSPFMFETSAFTSARKLAWNGNMWLAGGGGINSLAYSYNGINWIGLGNVLGSSVICMATAFNSARPHQITFPVSMMVATGSGTNTLAYSADGILWTGSGLGVFTTQGNGVASNGSMWVATGSGTNTLAYSTTDIETPYIYLPFENKIYMDVMGNSSTVLTGSISFIPGVRGSTAANFVNTAGGTGANYINVPWAGSTSFSISFCFNAQTISGVQQNIFTNTSGNLCFYIRPSTNALGFYIPRGGALVGTDAAITSYAISASTWYNVTGIFQAYGVCSLYVNNILVGSSINIGGLGTGIMDMWLGSWQSSGYQPFNGFIDDVRIYNYAITMNPKIIWRGLGTSVFSSQGKGVAWNGSMWVAVGGGTNSIAYSYDGITWIPATSSFSSSGNGVAWNGSMWVAVGSGTNSIAYSYDGMLWTGLGTSIFSIGNSVAWSGSMWVAVGSGTNTIAYSYNGISWTGLGVTLFTSSGNGVAWNNRWVAVGSGTNTILYSTNGINWTSAAVSYFTTAGNGITWSGSKWVATGSGTNTIGYSVDGSTWNKSQNITPNQTGLASDSWTQNGITWVSSASSTYTGGPGYPAYGAFNNYYGNVGVYSWATPSLYSVSDGSYTGSVSTTIQAGIGAKTGEWLQLQCSVPLVLSSYTYGCGANGQVPKTYYIVGSNDNRTWYPIQSCVMTINPLTTYSTTCTTYIVVNQSGIQTIFGGQTGSGTFTTYPPYTTMAYTYFRIILQTLWNSGTNGNAEFGEFYPNFNAVDNISLTNYVSYNTTTYGGASVITSTRNPNAYQITLVAASSQYLQTPSFTPTTNGITFSFWYKSNALTGLWQRIFDFGNGASSDNILCSPNAYDGTVGRLGFWVQSGGLSNNFYLTDINYNDNIWRHVTWTLTYAAAGSQTSTWNIYLNGVFKTTTTNYYPSTAVTRTASYIGKSNWEIDGYYNGFIDDFRVYNSVLTAQQVNTLYLGSGYGMLFSTAGSSVASNSLSGTVNIQHPVVAVGQGTHTLAYSPDGVRWTGLGTTMFSGTGYGVAWNGIKWIAGGLGSNTLAYSYDGVRWTGLGATIFSTQVSGVAWNGSIWVAVGSGTNTIASSTDGLAWTSSPSANVIFTSCNAVAWNGTQWVAVGAGTNSIAYSADGFVWTAIGSTVFSAQGNGICWTGSLWVAVGAGTNTIAYSTNGTSWTGLGTSIFSTSGNGVCWNGTRWVAVGTGMNTIAYSSNGTSWVGLGTSLLTTSGNGVCWTGTRFVAVGNTVGYSKDGLTWYASTGGIFTQGNGVAGNPRIGAVVCDSQVALSDSLDVVSDTYYNTGYTNFSAAIQAQTYTVDATSVAAVV